MTLATPATSRLGMASSGTLGAGAWASLLGVAAAVAFVLSPLAVLFVLAMYALVASAPVGLTGVERRWLMRLLVVALVLRIVALAAVFLYVTHPNWFSRDAIEILDGERSVMSLFGDEVYTKRRTLWMRDVWLGIPIAPANLYWAFQKPYGWTGYYYVIAFLQVLFGPAPFGINFVSTAVSLAGAVLLFRLVRPAFGAVASLGGLALTLFLPSLFIWSIAALKEPVYYALGVTGLATAIWALRARTWRTRIICAAIAAAAILANDAVRPGAALLTVVSVAVALAATLILGDRRRLLVAIVAALALVIGAGSRPRVQESVLTGVKTAAHKHLGNVFQPGIGYHTLDQRFYALGHEHETVETMTPLEAVTFVARSFWAFLTAPLPWEVESRSAIAFLPQHMLWYLMLLALPWGIAQGLRRDALVTLTLLAYAAGNASVSALNDGNVGTLVRHRDGVVPFVLWLSALGGTALLARLAPRAVEAD